MGFNRYARRADKSTQGIVDELRALGYTVEYVGRPVDLLVTHPSWPPNTWRLVECKTPKGKKGELKLRADQAKQQAFCATNGVPYVITPVAALTWLQANPIQSAEVPS
jgi:hypothetical protein